MKEKGILFSAPMVRALLNTKPGSWPAEPIDALKPWKWQTRRCLSKKQLSAWSVRGEVDDEGWPMYEDDQGDWHRIQPPIQAGDTLWVRETWRYFQNGEGNDVLAPSFTNPAVYAADYPDGHTRGTWKSPLFMPRRASRISLEVMEVRCERLNAITEADAKAEGVENGWPREKYPNFIDDMRYRASYSALWNKLNGDGSWENNPWVFVYNLRRIK